METSFLSHQGLWPTWSALRADYQRVLTKARNEGLLTMARTEPTDEGARLVVCGTWRIESAGHGEIAYATRNHATGEWVPGVWAGRGLFLAGVPFWPVASTRSLTWVFATAKCAISLLLGDIKLDERRPLTAEEAGRAGVLLDRLMKKHKLTTPFLLKCGGKGIIKALYTHFVRRDVIGAMMRTQWEARVELSEYVRYAAMATDVCRVAKERPNLMPLLGRIDCAYWRRTDLFSRRLWVRGTRTRTLVDSKRFADAHMRVRLHSFRDGRGWNWLSSMPPTVVRAWSQSHASSEWASLLANVRITQRVPVGVMAFLASFPPRARDVDTFLRALPGTTRSLLERAARALTIEAASKWRYKSASDVCAWVQQWAGWHDVLDYLFAEGFAGGFPTKQCTWPSLVRRSRDWHARRKIEQDAELAARSWTSVLAPEEIDGIRFDPLVTGRDLILEGIEQTHCIGSYINACAAGSYRVFRGHWGDGTRSTLGLTVRRGGVVRVEQHTLSYNRPVDDRAWGAGVALARRYQEALRGTRNRDGVRRGSRHRNA